MLLKKLQSEVEADPPAMLNQTVEGVSVDCVEYNVASQSVSMHLPLTRMLAGLNLHLHRYEKCP